MSQAAMLVYEPFAGYTAGNINGQLPNANTLGLNTTVGWTESGSGAGTINVVATGLTFSNLSVSGGAVSNPTSGIETATAQLSSAITGDLYESYLINIGSASATSAIFTSFGDSATGNTNRRFRVASESTNTHLIGTKYNTNAVVNGDAGLARDTVYMMLGRFTNVGGDTSVTSGVATAYALTAAQFDHFKALGMNDSDLDAATTGSADDNVTAKATDTLTSGTVTLPSNYFFQLVTTNAASNTFTIDEVRFGHSFAVVTPLAAAGLPGDFNSDGKVDAGDYATWRKNDVANAALANDNGVGNQAARFALWRANFGNPPGAGSGSLVAGSAVPEPASVWLLTTLASSTLVGWRRRRCV